MLLDNLRTAIEGKMDLAVVGVLNSIALLIEGSSDKQKAFYRVNSAPVIVSAIAEMGAASAICEKALVVISLLCRHSDENKASVSYDNAKALGLAGICPIVVAAILKYSEDPHLIEVSLDAIRCLCCLPSNRERFSQCGACEAVGRCLTKFSNNPDLCCWICRTLGHLANNSDESRELIGSVGTCENSIVVLQKYQHTLNLCTEVCWAIRNIAPIENNRARYANEHAPESISAVFKFHYSSETFAIEACQSLGNYISIFY